MPSMFPLPASFSAALQAPARPALSNVLKFSGKEKQEPAEDTVNICGFTGGGMAGINLVGALMEGDAQGKWHQERYNVFVGDSFGALIAAMAANGKSPREMFDFVKNTDIASLIKCMYGLSLKLTLVGAVAKPISLSRVGQFINDKLQLVMKPNLIINSWNMNTHRQEFYATKKPEWANDPGILPTDWVEVPEGSRLGKFICRSMALPGLRADRDEYLDGGLGEHPPLSMTPPKANVTVVNLGAPGIDQPMLNLPIKAKEMTRIQTMHFMKQETAYRSMLALIRALGGTVQEIRPTMNGVNVIDFQLTPREKAHAMTQARIKSRPDWENFEPPVEKATNAKKTEKSA